MARAAVLSSLGQPLEVRAGVEVEEPHPGEVKVRMVAAGVCHSDLSMQHGILPATLPTVLGHEGAAVVEEVGEGVGGLAPGDHVVVSWVPQCDACFFCSRGQPHLCQSSDAVLLTGGLLDGLPRLRLDGAPLQQMLGTGTFCDTTVVSASALVKVPDDLDMTVVAILGCAVVTGVGAALNTATIRPGDTVAVLGCGGVGLNVVQGARLAGAAEIVAVDIRPGNLALARRLGATTTVESSRHDPVGTVFDLTGQRGADVAFEAAGTGPTVEQAVALTRRGGEVVLAGIPPMEVNLTVPVFQGMVMAGKTIKGCWHGSSDFRRDVPALIEHYRSGRLLLDELVGRRIGLDQVNHALAELATGSHARSVVVHERR